MEQVQSGQSIVSKAVIRNLIRVKKEYYYQVNVIQMRHLSNVTLHWTKCQAVARDFSEAQAWRKFCVISGALITGVGNIQKEKIVTVFPSINMFECEDNFILVINPKCVCVIGAIEILNIGAAPFGGLNWDIRG